MRIIRKDIEVSVVHRIARDLEVPLYTASLIRRLFLLERCLGEPLYVEISGSAHHTRTGEGADGSSGASAEAAEAVRSNDEDIEGDDDERQREAHAYVNEGVLISVAVGLVHPVGRPFKRSRSSSVIYRHVRLTPTGQLLAAEYIRMEAAEIARRRCFAATRIAELVEQEFRAGHLSLTAPKPLR